MYTIKKNSRIPMYEKEAFAAYLSDMSEKGWRFLEVDAEDPDPNYYRRKLIFESLHGGRLYYGIGALDEDNIEKRNEFISSCERTGWRFVTKVGKLYIFCSESNLLPPIPSDKNTEAEIVESLKPKPMPDNYQIFLLIFFLISLVLTVTVYNDDVLYYYSSNFLLAGAYFIFFSVIATVIGRVFVHIRYKKARKAIYASQEPKKRDYKAAMLKKNICYTVSELILIPVLALILINPYAFSSSGTVYTSFNSNNIKLSDIIKVEELRRESGQEKLTKYVSMDYYYQENLPEATESATAETQNKLAADTDGAISLKNSIKPKSKNNERITVINYKFDSEEIAKEVYERDRSYNPLKNESELPKTDFTKEECDKLKISIGRYYYDADSDFLEIIMLKDKTYTIIYMNKLGGYNDKIAEAIAKR